MAVTGTAPVPSRGTSPSATDPRTPEGQAGSSGLGQGYRSTPAARREAGGTIALGSLRACDRYAIWTTSSTSGLRQEVRRLGPDGKVEVIWASEKAAQLPSALYCSDGWLSFAVLDRDTSTQASYALRMFGA